MRITQEADYALRIVSYLAISDSICGASEISDSTGVPVRFAHKILRKLLQANIVRSYTGARGGYELLRDPRMVSMLEIIEQIDGPFEITKCADASYVCSKNGLCKASCVYHRVFRQLASEIADKLRRLSIAELTDPERDVTEILKIIA